MKMSGFVRKADINDLSRIAEIQVFNYRLYFYPIFQSDDYYFDELGVPSLMKEYESDLDSLYVYDDGVVMPVKKGDSIFLPANFGAYSLRGKQCSFICTQTLPRK